MFFFVFMFIVWVSDYVDLPRNTVDLANTQFAKPVPEANREDALHVTLQRDGTIYFGYLKVLDKDLPPLLRDGMKKGSEHKVFLNVDARAKYSDVERVIDQIRISGIENVVLLTEQSDHEPAS